MRRVNVHLEEDLDADLAAEAARRGESKAALLRQAAREFLGKDGAESAWDYFTGAVKDAPADDRPHDEIIYGT